MKKIDLEALYRRYFKETFLFLKSLSSSEEVAEEITQETFFKVIKAIDTFDGSKDIRAWIFAIARNTYYTHYKKSKAIITEPFIEDVPDHGIEVSVQIMNEDTAFVIHQILHDMDEPYKEVFSLRVFGELPFEKIGLIFNKNASWARVTFYRAKNKLLKTLEGLDEES
ncbi:RNA polymerase, sigma-24 subunit, ECF subfamily [Desulfitobacterium hafniense DCB-2]|uniref:RNA polymerase, sigma-24 subunit, ECF subfamily n=1 Tax=Desulfitobacterium hafniense (strain DSM 10664 / DCB-2) TaxID=272564 RepID=B8FW44_DESHD|nr:RNA polymerase sigma factor [Desulfitobacterium hafniense]ACL18830.1 RNA polymerase, sigma-24 subunit, ECF subfamily [Desulfitobacterium hafniense DCB-2]